MSRLPAKPGPFPRGRGEGRAYEEALAWLFGRTRSGAARTPQRARVLLDRLGRPDERFEAVQVVGTNGKGSVAAMLDAGLRASGRRVGRFTSPHLVDFRERIAVDGVPIGPGEVAAFVERARARGFDGAFFDLTLAMAAEHFGHSGVEVAVVEAGVGGALDATSALARVSLTVLTNVSMDHIETIGPTLERIAREKAGAVRPGVPVVTGATGEALAVLREVAAERGAPVLALAGGLGGFELPAPPRMRGAHQVQNARLAARALRLLGATDDAVAASGRAVWPARLEGFRLLGRRVIVDGAHNPDGARAAAASLPAGATLVFGVMARKDVDGILVPLLERAAGAVFVNPGSELGADPGPLARRHGGRVAPDVGAALELALEAAGPGGTVAVVGSLYLAGRARALLLERGAVGEDAP